MNPTDRPTPETDEIAKAGGVSVWEHARRLERERDEARAELAALREDKARLDWLEAHNKGTFGIWPDGTNRIENRRAG